MARVEDAPTMDEQSDEASLAVEAVRLAQWRRVILSGDTPGLTLAEAAAVLGLSVESVRRRIRSGQLFATRNARGAIRVAPLVGTPEAPHHRTGEPSSVSSRLWEEFKAARLELDRAFHEWQLERQTLAEKLIAATREIEFLRRQLGSFRTADAPGEVSGLPPGAPPERIQAKLVDIREQKRRRPPGRWSAKRPRASR